MRVFTVFVNFVKEGTKKEKTSCVKEERLKFCYILLFNLELKYNKNYYLLYILIKRYGKFPNLAYFCTSSGMIRVNRARK